MDNNLVNKKDFAENLKFYMSQYGYSSKEIAEKIGVKESSVSYWINAVYYPRIDKIEKLANLFHVSKANLVEAHRANIVLKKGKNAISTISAEETSLLEIWRKANYDDKFAVYGILRKYGMPEPVSEDTIVISVS